MAQRVKNLSAMWRPGLGTWVGRSTGEGNDNPLQHSGLENPMDRRAWWAMVHGGRKESDTTV